MFPLKRLGMGKLRVLVKYWKNQHWLEAQDVNFLDISPNHQLSLSLSVFAAFTIPHASFPGLLNYNPDSQKVGMLCKT